MSNEAERFAAQCYANLQLDAPADVPTWEDLHDVERDHLVRFANEVKDEVIREKWHTWRIKYEMDRRGHRGELHETWVLAANAKDARRLFEETRTRCRVRAVQLERTPERCDECDGKLGDEERGQAICELCSSANKVVDESKVTNAG